MSGLSHGPGSSTLSYEVATYCGRLALPFTRCFPKVADCYGDRPPHAARPHSETQLHVLKKTMILAGAFAMLALAAPAQADITSGRNGVLSGNQLFFPITAPINVCGNAVAVIGVAVAGCKGGAGAHVHR